MSPHTEVLVPWIKTGEIRVPLSTNGSLFYCNIFVLLVHIQSHTILEPSCGVITFTRPFWSACPYLICPTSKRPLAGSSIRGLLAEPTSITEIGFLQNLINRRYWVKISLNGNHRKTNPVMKDKLWSIFQLISWRNGQSECKCNICTFFINIRHRR